MRARTAALCRDHFRLTFFPSDVKMGTVTETSPDGCILWELCAVIFDCFFSYQHDDLELVKSIVKELEARNIICWYAPRNVKGKYAKAIVEGISHSKVFVLILNSRSAVSEAVLNEVEMAHNIGKNGDYAVIQPVCTESFDFNAPDYQEMMYYIRRSHFVDAEDGVGIGELAERIIKSQPGKLNVQENRTNSAYVVQDIEDNRLALQNELLDLFDKDVYEAVISQYAEPTVLDVGCGTGDMLIPKLRGTCVSAFVGVDKSPRQMAAAEKKYGGSPYFFYELDVEEEAFETKLQKVLSAHDMEAFDIINISMLLLHLKDPTKLLRVLHRYLSEDGTLIIRDIDDGINFAFPDPARAFDRIYTLCDHDEQSGNRRNGRQIHHYLVEAGFTNITLEHQGLSSAGMSTSQREALFRMYFPFTLENAKIMAEKYPRNIAYQEDYLWYQSCYDQIHQQFLSPDFIFSLGFMSYTARK